MHNRMLFVLFGVLFCSKISIAEVYKSTDELGRVIYSDKSVSEDSEIVDILDTDSEINTDYQKHLNKIKKLNEVFESERLDKQRERSRKIIEKRELKRKCSKAKIKLQKYKDAKYLYRRTDDPNNPIIATDEQRKEQTERLENKINEWCK